MWYEILYAGRLYVLLFRSRMMSSRLEAYISAKFSSDGKAWGERISTCSIWRKREGVIKHNSYFGLDICGRSWLKEFVFRIRAS